MKWSDRPLTPPNLLSQTTRPAQLTGRLSNPTMPTRVTAAQLDRIKQSECSDQLGPSDPNKPTHRPKSHDPPKVAWLTSGWSTQPTRLSRLNQPSDQTNWSDFRLLLPDETCPNEPTWLDWLYWEDVIDLTWMALPTRSELHLLARTTENLISLSASF